MTKLIVHIVPYLPPQNSGVGHYAMVIGRCIEQTINELRCGYIAAGEQRVKLPANDSRTRNVTSLCQPHLLWKALYEICDGCEIRGAVQYTKTNGSRSKLSNVTVVLHYSGYGYDRNGCPEWLVQALQQRPVRVVTFFHELYASSPPWRRAYWYSPSQRKIAAEIAELSDAILTNREQSARWLEQAISRPVGSIASLPVPSNVGQLTQYVPLSSRSACAVLFGSARNKRMLVRNAARKIAWGLRDLNISELIDIGATADYDLRYFRNANIHVRRAGYLNAVDISAILQNTRFGFIKVRKENTAKSGIYAAYIAHGVIPVFERCVPYSVSSTSRDGVLTISIPDLSTIGKLVNSEKYIESVSRALWTTYQNRSSEKHAEVIVRLGCNENATASSQT